MDCHCDDRSRCHETACVPHDVQEYEFTLKVRVKCHNELRAAAAERVSERGEVDLAELLGPADDPSVKDCLMALMLPQAIEGCTMLSVSLD